MLFLRYLQASWHHGAVPWNFFKLNSRYFNEEKGIFSKLDRDQLIPQEWRLTQELYDPQPVPAAFPVFIKPEWGQNATGIVCLRNAEEFRAFSPRANRAMVPYIVQQANFGHREFEVHYLRSPGNPEGYDAFFLTQVINRSRQPHPINSVHNPDTSYLDITSTLNEDQRSSPWNQVAGIGQFKMVRLCLKADSLGELTQGHFQVVEINLFLPIPLVLLADNVGPTREVTIAKQLMSSTARLVTTIPSMWNKKKQKKRSSKEVENMHSSYGGNSNYTFETVLITFEVQFQFQAKPPDNIVRQVIGKQLHHVRVLYFNHL